MANSNATNLETIKLTYDAWLTAYKLAVVAAGTIGPKPDYSVGGQSVSWQAVYTNGPKIITDLRKLITEMEWSAGGPVDTWQRA